MIVIKWQRKLIGIFKIEITDPGIIKAIEGSNKRGNEDQPKYFFNILF
jgi:hypothetical protein